MLTILGCGNTNRSDDAAGVVVAQRLLQKLIDAPKRQVQVIDAGTSGIETMFRARGSDALIVVDANLSNSKPGTVFEVPGDELENRGDVSVGVHEFRWDHAIHAGRKIFREDYPKSVTVFLIEASNTDLGLELSAPVAAAVEKVVEIIWQRVCALPLAASDDVND